LFEWVKNFFKKDGTAKPNLFQNEEYQKAFTRMELWDSYYRNDISMLRQYAANIEVYKKSTVSYPAAYRIGDKVAKLVFTELPKFTFAEKSQKRLDYIINKNDLFQLLRRAQTEVCGVGNAYLKVNVDPVKDYPIIELVRGVNAIPAEVDWTTVTGVTFFILMRKINIECYWLGQTYKKDKVSGNFVIENRLYKGTMMQLGEEVALTMITETAEKPPIDDLQTELPWFYHLKSPMPNNKNPDSVMGIAITANSLEMIDHLNLTLQSYYKDDKLKQPKVIVTEDLLHMVRGKTSVDHSIDFGKEFYVKLSSVTGDQIYKVVDMPSKQGDFEESIHGKLDRIYESCGLFRGAVQKNSGAKTATEWELADKDSIDTGNDYKNNWLTILDKMFRSIMEIDNRYYQDAGVTEKTKHNIRQEILIQFMDGVKNDYAERADTAKTLYAANMQSLQTSLIQIYPLWSEKRVIEEIALMNQEQTATAKASEIDFFKAEGNNEEK